MHANERVSWMGVSSGFVAQSRLPRLVASWHDGTPRVPRRAARPPTAYNAALNLRVSGARLPPQKLGWTTQMHGFKRLGARVMARTFERQVAELHGRVALLNRFTQLGRPTTVPAAAMAQLRLGLGLSRCAFDLCNKAAVSRGAEIPTSAKNPTVFVWPR